MLPGSTFNFTKPVRDGPEASGTTWRRTLPEAVPHNLHGPAHERLVEQIAAAHVGLVYLNLLVQQRGRGAPWLA